MILVVDHRASAELEAAIRWFENERSGLAVEFKDAVLRLLDSIEADPFSFSPVPGTRHLDQYRIAFDRRFRYSVVFQVLEQKQSVLVLSVQHGHRRPGGWQDRSKTFSP